MGLSESNYDNVPPHPAALIESLRSVGYSLPTAVADIVDNSIAASASTISIDFHWNGRDSSVVILDDGVGMSEDDLRTAMRPGSRHPLERRAANDLGRFGLGLKTASLSQCRKLCVLSKRCGGELHVRTWDLAALMESPDWRLLKEPSAAGKKILAVLGKADCGTAVVWSDLDRLIGNDDVGNAAAHSRFNIAIDNVREHLALTFHRFLEDRSIKLILNGHSISHWNPFMKDSRVQALPTPEELIPFGQSMIKFQGFVLPHKDTLPDGEFERNQGPRGWVAQQGFYVYRNKRLLVFGDWLRLGRPKPWTQEEQYKLARIRVDIQNDSDAEWHLDVKKSTARPPALIRERLTDLAERVRNSARSIFAHRGKYGRRVAPSAPTERPWRSIMRENRRVYSINREHPAIQAVRTMFPDRAPELEALLRLLEETVPVEQIWLDTAEQSRDHAPPYAGVDFSVLKADMRRVLDFLIRSGINPYTAKERLRTIEPFDRYPDVINEL